MKNLDDFFGDDQSKNVDTLIEVTKRFFGFVSQLAEIVDELQNSFLELSKKVDQVLQRPTSAVGPPPAPLASSAPPPAPATSGTPMGLPTPPAPVTASAPPSTPSPTPSAPSGLPPLPGLSPTPQQPPASQPGFPGLSPAPQPAAPAPRASPMSLKAQMNMELKEAFARIKKGWNEDG